MVLTTGVGHNNKVTLRWARIVLGWVTVSKFDTQCGLTNLNRLTHPSHPSVSRRIEYQLKGGDSAAGECLVVGKTVYSIV